MRWLILHHGFYWPTILKDRISFAKGCLDCHSWSSLLYSQYSYAAYYQAMACKGLGTSPHRSHSSLVFLPTTSLLLLQPTSLLSGLRLKRLKRHQRTLFASSSFVISFVGLVFLSVWSQTGGSFHGCKGE